MQKLNYLQGHFESRQRSHKPAARHSATRTRRTTLPPATTIRRTLRVEELTQIFQSIATTAEMARKLIHDARFNKLGVDADLKALQEEQREGNAVEIIAAQAILQKIAEDPNMMRMSQQRAKAILRAAGVGRPERYLQR